MGKSGFQGQGHSKKQDGHHKRGIIWVFLAKKIEQSTHVGEGAFAALEPSNQVFSNLKGTLKQNFDVNTRSP